MVPFKGTEIIRHQIDLLLSENISKITIVSGYRSKELKDFIKKFFRRNKNCREQKIFKN